MSDFNDSRNDACSRVVMLLQKLEELEAAGARSVALEMECLVEEEPWQLDEHGRRQIKQLCKEIHEACQKMSVGQMRSKLEEELSNAVNGKSRWFLSSSSSVPSDTAAALSEPGASEVGMMTEDAAPTGAAGNGGVDAMSADFVLPTSHVDRNRPVRLAVARGKKPLSLWGWKIWTMARPRLWRYGDAGNLFERETSLATSGLAYCCEKNWNTTWVRSTTAVLSAIVFPVTGWLCI